MTNKRFFVETVEIIDCDTDESRIAKVITDTKETYSYEDLDEIVDLLNEQQATISRLEEENEQLKNELRKEKSLREYSDSMYGADLIVNIRFSNGEWKADVSVIDDD